MDAAVEVAKYYDFIESYATGYLRTSHCQGAGQEHGGATDYYQELD